MAARNFLPRCTAFYNRIPIDSLTIPDSNTMHLGKKFLAAIFSVIVYPIRDGILKKPSAFPRYNYIHKQRTKLESTLYAKPTDSCSLLHKQSFHPATCKQSVIYSQALRYRRIITDNETLRTKLGKLKTNLFQKRLLNQEINQQFQNVQQLSQTDALFGNSQPTM